MLDRKRLKDARARFDVGDGERMREEWPDECVIFQAAPNEVTKEGENGRRLQCRCGAAADRWSSKNHVRRMAK